MAREVRAFTCTIPANTLPGAAASFDIGFPPREVDTIEIVVPPGPSGVVGFYLANSDVRVIPYASDEWLIMSGEKVSWPLDGYINSGSWQLFGYNTGVQDHTIYVRFLLSLPAHPGASVITQPIDTDLLDNTPSAGVSVGYGG